MAITVKEAYKAADTLTQLELEEFVGIESYIDDKIASNFDGSTSVEVTLEKHPSPRLLKHIKRVYSAAGWDITNKVSSGTCILVFSEHFYMPAHRDCRD